MKFETLFKTHFAGIVGQDTPKLRIAKSVFGSSLEEGYMSPLLIIAPPGIGKTRLLKAARALFKAVWGEKRKTIWCPSGEELGTVKTFFEDVLNPYVEGQDACFFIDEFHKTPKALQSLFRSMIEITESREPKSVRSGDYEVTISPKRHGFIFATNEIDKLDPALVSRCKRIDLSLYSDEEMEKILFNALENDGIHFHENTLRAIAECNRGTARNIVHWIDGVRQFLAFAGKKSLNREDVVCIIRESETFPLGLSKIELATLLILEKHGRQKLKELAAKNLCDSTEQNTNERFLLQRGLMQIDGERELTKEGREYLAQLRKDKLIAPLENPANIS